LAHSHDIDCGAAQEGQEAVVKLLLETDRVNVNLQDSKGRTLLWWAEENGHKAVVELLQSHPILS
jgi:ankyrin repeat protein